MSSFDYDLFVIGAGSGGVRASRIASQLGAKVAVAEDLYLGGTCVNVGCVPKKLFVYSSQVADDVLSAQGLGWSIGQPTFDWQTLKENKDKEIKRLNGVYENILNSAGVELLHGTAKILGPNRVAVGEKTYSADKILIAVGGWPKKPSFPGAEFTFTSNDVFHLEKIPKRILVHGGGYIAAEFAGIFNGWGCETEIAYRGPLFLRGFDEEVRVFVAEQMAEKGITLSFNTDIVRIEKQSDGSLKVHLNTGEIREVDGVYTAVGREPKVAGLGLENTQVKTKSNGHIIVDDNFETAEPGIFAVGDVVGRMQLTPVALGEGMAVARYLFANEPVDVNYHNIATAIFTQPNIATVGYTEDELQKDNVEYHVYRSTFKAMKQTLGGLSERIFMKLLVENGSEKILGAHMVGEHAGEIIQSIAIAIKAGATKKHFDSTIGIHPTAAEEFVTMRNPGEKYQSKLK